MKVFFVTDHCIFPPATSGARAYYNYLRVFAELDEIEISLYTQRPNSDPEGVKEYKDIKEKLSNIYFHPEIPQESTFERVAKYFTPFAWKTKWSNELVRLIRLEKVEAVILCYSSYFAIRYRHLLDKIREMENRPTVVLNPLDSYELQLASVKRKPYHFWQRKMCYRVLNHPAVQAIFYVAQKDLMADRPFISNKKGYVLPFFIWMEGLQPSLKKNNNKPLKCMFVADYRNYINIDSFEILMKELVENSIFKDSVRFMFAGEGMSERQRMWIESLPNTTILPFMPDITDLYKHSDIVLLPLTCGTGIKVRALEAMAFGCVLLATNFAVKGLDVKPDVHYIQAEVGHLAQSLQKVVNGNYQLDDMRLKAFEYVSGLGNLKNLKAYAKDILSL